MLTMDWIARPNFDGAINEPGIVASDAAIKCEEPADTGKSLKRPI